MSNATLIAAARGRIGFVIYYPFQFYVYKNIYKQLEEQSEFILDLTTSLGSDMRAALKSDICALLNVNDVKYRVIEHDDYYNDRYVRVFFAPFQALVSVWERGCMVNRNTAHCKKICATYGVGKELTMVRPSRGLYDLILAYGPRDQALFSYYTESEAVGNPKFDDWFNGSVSEGDLRTSSDCIDPSKKTLLYAPTHSDLSSIDAFTPQLAALRREYNIIAKVHYYTTREEPLRMQALRRAGIIVLPDSTDLLPLLKTADVVLSDNSSVIFDVILADRPLVVADLWDREFLDLQHKELRQYARGNQGALTFSGSIEQTIKKEGWVVTVSDPSELGEEIKEALRDDDHFKVKRSELRAELFSHEDAFSARRAAQAIKNCIAQTTSRPRPIMYHAIEAYKRHIGVLSYEREKYLNSELGLSKSLLDKKLHER